MATTAYIGKGTMYTRKSSEAGFTSLGNCSKVSLSIAEDKKELMDYENSGGGIADRISRIKSVSLSITSHRITAASLARFLRGTSATTTSTTSYTLPASTTYNVGELIALPTLPDTITSVTVNGVVKTAGTDYQKTNVGILVKTAMSTSTGASSIVYTHKASSTIEPMVSSNEDFAVIFDGLNEAASNTPVSIRCHRVQFSPLKSIDLIGDDFANIEIEGEVMMDTTQTGTSSKYFQIMMA